MGAMMVDKYIKVVDVVLCEAEPKFFFLLPKFEQI